MKSEAFSEPNDRSHLWDKFLCLVFSPLPVPAGDLIRSQCREKKIRFSDMIY